MIKISVHRSEKFLAEWNVSYIYAEKTNCIFHIRNAYMMYHDPSDNNSDLSNNKFLVDLYNAYISISNIKLIINLLMWYCIFFGIKLRFKTE